MSGARSRRKGATGERELANILAGELGVTVRRTAPMQAGCSTAAPDVDLPGWWIECKRGARPSPAAALRQATAATDGRPPVAITRADREGWTVLMRLEDWIDLVKEAR